MVKRIWALGGLSTLATLILLLNGCEGKAGPVGPTGVTGPPGPTVASAWAVVEAQKSSLRLGSASADLIPSNRVASVTVDSVSIPPTPWGYELQGLPIFGGDSVTIEMAFEDVSGNQALAAGGVRVPGNFSVISHDTSVTASLTLGSPITVAWNPAAGSDAYYVYASYWYVYRDVTGAEFVASIYIDSLLQQAAITLVADRLFPPHLGIVSISYGDGALSVEAIGGPMEPGDLMNILGDARGPCFAWNYGGTVYFDVNPSAACQVSP